MGIIMNKNKTELMIFINDRILQIKIWYFAVQLTINIFLVWQRIIKNSKYLYYIINIIININFA